jgi:multiple antibiotic resistance protein
MLLLKTCVLAFSALLPVINPVGSALLFMGVVGQAPPSVFRSLARKVALSTVLFLLIVELAGAGLLAFFEISLPVVQLAGGFVLAAMGWQLLNKQAGENVPEESAPAETNGGGFDSKVFYPLTFPLTAGPGCIVVAVTLSAHVSGHSAADNVLGHLGIALAIVAIGATVALCYAYAPKITRKIAPQTVQGILRVIAFVVLCIGVQIARNGLVTMVTAASK